MKVYTRTGDDGSTGLGDGSRVSKSSLRVAAYGDVDELNAVLGVLRAEDLPPAAAAALARAQALLFEVGAFLARPDGGFALPDDVLTPAWIEGWIDAMEADLEPLRVFVLPAGTRGAAVAHLARTVCRRGERAIVGLARETDGGGAETVVPFVNRLSDALFVLARWLNRRAGVADTPWRARA